MNPESLLPGMTDGAWLVLGIAVALAVSFGTIAIASLLALGRARHQRDLAKARQEEAAASRTALEDALAAAEARAQVAEAALARAGEHQAQLAALAPMAVISLDPDGRVLRWNARATDLFGWHATEILGQPLPLAIPGMGPLRDALLRDHRLAPMIAGSDIELEGRDGVRIVHLAVATLKTDSADAEPGTLVLMARDRTAELDAENERREVNAAFAVLLRRLREQDQRDRDDREPVRLRPVS